MPIFEFGCMECGHVFEKLFMNPDEEVELACPKCQCEWVERVISRTHYTMGVGPGGNQPRITSKSCGESSQCMTLDLPGPVK